jgi:hypothetical protein
MAVRRFDKPRGGFAPGLLRLPGRAGTSTMMVLGCASEAIVRLLNPKVVMAVVYGFPNT